MLPVCSLLLCQTEVDKYAMSFGVVVQEVCRLDVSVKDAGFVHPCQPTKQASKIQSHVIGEEVSVVEAEVEVSEVGEDSDNLVLVSECSKEWTDVGRCAQLVEELELVEDAER